MRKVWVVAVREYRSTVQTKAFMISIFLMPILMAGGFIVQSLTEGRVDVADKKIAVMDASGRVFSVLAQAMEKRNREETQDPTTKRQVQPRYVLEEVKANEEKPEDQLLTLSDRVRSGELFAFVVIPPGLLEQQSGGANAAIRYYSNQPTYDYVRRWLEHNINEQVSSARLAQAGIDREVVSQALRPVGVENLGLTERGAGGSVKQAEKVNEGIAFGVPFGMVMLMFMSISITAGPLLNGVLEEKMQRIAEVLLGSVPPFELMLGKLLGSVGIAVTLVAVYFSGGFILLKYYNFTSAIPFHLLAWFVLFQVLCILMYGSIFLALGACCNDVKEAQSLMMPVWLVLCIPMFVLGVVLQHPNSTFSLLLSLFPPATPMLMMLRMAVPPGIALWQPVLGVALVLVMTAISVWAAGRVFRVALLMQGKPPKLGQILRWAVQG